MIRLVEQTEDHEKAVSALALVEVRSAIRRRERAREITPAHAASAVSSAQDESRRLIEHLVSANVTARATALIDGHALRSLDAIQLATALLVLDMLPSGDKLTFVCSDTRLLAAAAAEALIPWNPETQ